MGELRHVEHGGIPEIHAELVRRGVAIRVRGVGNLVDRYDELLALSCSGADRLKAIAAKAGRVILAIDGLLAALARHGDFRGGLAAEALVRGSARLIAAAATRLRPIGPADLIPPDVAAWRKLRASLERRQAVRALGRRFRRDPDAYLRSLETSLINRVCHPEKKTGAARSRWIPRPPRGRPRLGRAVDSTIHQ